MKSGNTNENYEIFSELRNIFSFPPRYYIEGSFENNQHPVSVDDLLNMAKLYKTDVRELILENYVDEKEEQVLCNRYGSFLKLFDQLSDRDKEVVI